jgi:hypothetical protein
METLKKNCLLIILHFTAGWFSVSGTGSWAGILYTILGNLKILFGVALAN